MTAAEQLRAQAQQARARLAPGSAADPAPEPVTGARQTFDLNGDRRLAFNAWKLEAALALGRSRPLTTQETCVAMVEALDDEVVARRVRALLERPR